MGVDLSVHTTILRDTTVKTNTNPSSEPILRLSGITKQFAGALALKNVSLRLFAGEVHALMGQNGAGKSTLIKVLTGVYPADEGVMLMEGRPIAAASPLESQHLGISTVYQEVNLCPNLTVAENIFAGRYPRHGAQRAWAINWALINSQARQWLGRLNLDIDVTQLLSSYPVAVQQMVAIARALSISARVLILDEPTSSLDDDEVERLFKVLRQLRDEGMAILFITHMLNQVYALCERITVLRNGELVGEYLASDLDQAALIAAMVGREVKAVTSTLGPASAEQQAQAPVLLQAQGLARGKHLKPIDLTLRQGEVVGLGGLLGSGRTELARTLFGLDRSDAGTLSLHGEQVHLESPVQAIARGVGLCPEDRKDEGIIGELSVRENIALAIQARQGLWPFISHARQSQLALHYVNALGIKTADIETPIAQLSGGNQQKAVLARWLATQPSLLILDEPTRGIDVAAKQEIMSEILRLAHEGMTVLFISSEMDEVVRLSDRIVVMRERAKVGELPGGGTEQDVYAMIAEHAA